VSGQRLGQHFLRNQPILEKIADAACDPDEPLVVEIGPGRGALTKHLLTRARRVVAIEVDDPLAARLILDYPQLEVIHADVLKADLSEYGRAVIAGNLPYYITSPIIERTLSLGPLLKRAVFLVQREVADRLAAVHGSRDYGYLSVSVQSRCRVERLFVVKPAAFSPPPKVDSAVVRLTPLSAPLAADVPAFLRFVSLCFRQKRKMLRNNLSGSVAPELLATLPESSLRAEQLPIEALLSLYLRVKAGLPRTSDFSDTDSSES
jgi:16S rRNA (adenine1518-N6/adenine1519-N6)-dimethyltransferase